MNVGNVEDAYALVTVVASGANVEDAYVNVGNVDEPYANVENVELLYVNGTYGVSAEAVMYEDGLDAR